MTLTVSGSSQFRAQVEAALEENCPCWDLVIDAAGDVGVVTASPDCACYCRHTAGCNLITSLRTDPTLKFTIDISEGDSEYDGDLNTVFWSPTDTGPDDDKPAGTEIPPSVILAHELTHAWLDLEQQDWRDEVLAVRGENHVRRERSLPSRKTYSGDGVPDYDKPVLDTSDLQGCGCADQPTKTRVCILRLVSCLIRFVRAILWGVRAIFHPEASLLPAAPIPFDRYGHGSGFLVDQYRRALRVRGRALHREVIDSLRPRFDAAPVGLHMEDVGVVGRYRVIWLAHEAEGLTLVCNLRLDVTPNKPFAIGPGELVEYQITEPQLVARVIDALAQLHFSDGLGGNLNRVDGAVKFLWLRRPAGNSHMAIYGYGYPATHGSFRRPDILDGPRWDAVVAAYEVWSDVVRAAGRPVRTLAGAEG